MITPISQTTKTNTRPQTITCSRKSNISLERIAILLRLLTRRSLQNSNGSSVNSRCIGGNVEFGDFEIISPQKLNAEQKKERWPKVMTRDVQMRMSAV
jgi:hypothetical protein